jgi:hypothetical protein
MLSFVLAAYLVWQARRPVAPPPILNAPSPSLEAQEARAGARGAQDVTDAPPVSIENYAAVVERSLFVVSRRPPPAPAESASKPSSRSGQDLRLTAVAISEQGRYALIRSKKDNKTYRLKEGETVNGWMLAEVRPDGVTLRTPDEVRSLPLLRERSPAEAPQADQVKGLLEKLRARAQSGGTTAPTPSPTEPSGNEGGPPEEFEETGAEEPPAPDDPSLQPTQEIVDGPPPTANNVEQTAEPTDQE